MPIIKLIATPTMFLLGFGYVPGVCFVIQFPLIAVAFYQKESQDA